MRRDVEEPVARNDSVLAGPADPVVRDAAPGREIDELHTRSTEDEISIRRPIAVAPQVRHAHREERIVGGSPLHDGARPRVTTPYLAHCLLRGCSTGEAALNTPTRSSLDKTLPEIDYHGTTQDCSFCRIRTHDFLF